METFLCYKAYIHILFKLHKMPIVSIHCHVKSDFPGIW